MSKAVKGMATDTVAPQDMTFELALKELEQIVVSMESSDLPLDHLLAGYGRGTELYQLCQKRLGEAESKIQQLEKGAAGQPSVKTL